MFLRFPRILPIMAWNQNRFIPTNWLQAAEAARQTCSAPWRTDFTSDDHWWGQTQLGGYYARYYPSPMAYGSYQTYSPIQRQLPPKKNARKQEGIASTSKILKKDHKVSKHDKKTESRHHAPSHSHCDQKTSGVKKQESDRSGISRFSQCSSSTSWRVRDPVSGRKWHNKTPFQSQSWRRYSETSNHRSHKQYGIPTPSAAFEQDQRACTSENADGASSLTETESNTTDSEMRDDFVHQLERRWEDIDPPTGISDCPHSMKKQIRIVSYNILSQKLLNLNSYLYKKCDPDILLWEYRWTKLKGEIQEFDADILCLQEVEECHYQDDIFDFLQGLHYECHYKRRTGNNKNKPDGVLIAFKKHNFELCFEKKVEYYRGNISPVNQDNVAVITLLKPLFHDSDGEHDSCICLVNTHLLYNPRRGDIKLAQLATLFSEIQHIVPNHKTKSKIPIVMCGDFNSIPESYLFNFITDGEIDYEGLETKHVSGQKVGSKGKLVYMPSPLLPKCTKISVNGCVRTPKNTPAEDNPQSSETQENYKLRHSLGPLFSSHSHDKPEASTTQDKGVTVDYIFHSPYESIKGKTSIFPTKRLSLIHPRDLKRTRGIPNAVNPSDHLPLVVDFTVIKH